MTIEDRDTDGTALIDAIGRASEALEYVQRARGHLYSMHQLIGRADLLFEEAADLFRSAGQAEAADRLDREVVGRNVLDGRWTDDLYHGAVTAAVRQLEAEFHGGERHVYEVLHLDGKAPDLGVEGRALRHGPAGEDAVIASPWARRLSGPER